MTYNITFMDNATNILELATGVAQSFNNEFFLGNIFLAGFFMVFLAFAFKEDFLTVLIIDGFISTLVAVLLYTSGLLSVVTVVYPLLIMILALVFKFITR